MVKGLPVRKNAVYAALFSPCDEDESLDEGALRNLVRHELAHGVEGFYCCGSSGEGLLLEESERERVVEIVGEEATGKVPFIVHTGSLSTREAIRLSQHAQEHGAAAVSMIPPIYYHYRPDEVEGYYEDVVHNVDLGVIVYNIPQFTGISFSKENRLMADQRIIGIKHTSMNLYDLERMSQAFPDKVLFNGFDEIWLYAQVAGATATIGTTCNICPRLYAAVRDAFQAGDMEKARALQHLVNDFVENLVKAGIFPAAKYCLELQGVPIGGCRRPFKPLDEEGKERVRQALTNMQEFL